MVGNPDRASRLAHSTLKEVWTAYYTWEKTVTSQVLKSLARSQGVAHSYDVDENSQTFIHGTSSLTTPTLKINNGLADAFVLRRFKDGQPVISMRNSPEVEIVMDEFSPCMPYESCTPTPQNTFVGDDSADMPFIPLADDLEFDLDIHLLEYSTFSWKKQNDPDGESELAESGSKTNMHI